MKYAAIFITAAVSLVCCKSKNDFKSDILPPEKMQLVLWDVLRTDVFAFNYIKNDSTKKPEAELAKLQTQVFAVHKTSKEQFTRSYDFYKAHPDLMQAMLDSMINKYSREKYDVYKTKTSSPLIKDSLKAQ